MIPNVTGKPFDDAKKEIEDAGYICVERNVDAHFAHEKDGGVRFNNPDLRRPCGHSPAGTVICQDPPGGITRLGDERGAPRVFLECCGAPDAVPVMTKSMHTPEEDIASLSALTPDEIALVKEAARQKREEETRKVEPVVAEHPETPKPEVVPIVPEVPVA